LHRLYLLSSCLPFQYITEGGALQLYSARNFGEDPLKLARLPFELDENRYTILESTENLEMLSVEHGDTRWGNIYVSDNEESNFALSLGKSAVGVLPLQTKLYSEILMDIQTLPKLMD
jgi:hypothetical protein